MGQKMLTRKQIEQIAEDYLIKNNYPIVIASGRVTLPEDEDDAESRKYLEDKRSACVDFQAIDDSSNPFNELIPAVFIVYVDLITGAVHMPRHMA